MRRPAEGPADGDIRLSAAAAQLRDLHPLWHELDLRVNRRNGRRFRAQRQGALMQRNVKCEINVSFGAVGFVRERSG